MSATADCDEQIARVVGTIDNGSIWIGQLSDLIHCIVTCRSCVGLTVNRERFCRFPVVVVVGVRNNIVVTAFGGCQEVSSGVVGEGVGIGNGAGGGIGPGAVVALGEMASVVVGVGDGVAELVGGAKDAVEVVVGCGGDAVVGIAWELTGDVVGPGGLNAAAVGVVEVGCGLGFGIGHGELLTK